MIELFSTISDKFGQIQTNFLTSSRILLSAINANLEKTRFQNLHDRKLVNSSIYFCKEYAEYIGHLLLEFFIRK